MLMALQREYNTELQRITVRLNAAASKAEMCPVGCSDSLYQNKY